MYVIYCFTAETPHGKSLCGKQNILSLVSFFPLDQTPKIKIYHMVVSENTEVIEGRRRLIATYVLESEEAAEDGFIDDCGAALVKRMIVVQERWV